MLTMIPRVAARLTTHGCAALWFAALAILISYPLVRSLDTHVPGSAAGDNLASVWNFWWARYVRADPSADYLRTTSLFAPFGTSLVLNTHTALQAWIGATILGGATVVRAHNLMLIAGLAANGFATYLLAYAFGRQVWPAAVAGTAFATSAYLSIHLSGHFNLVHAWVLPAAMLAWVSLLASPNAVRAGIAGMAFAATAYSDYYYLVYVTVCSIVWWSVTATEARLIWRPERFPMTRRVLLALACMALVVGVAIRMTSGISFDVGSIHVSATQARNPTAFAGLCLLAWCLLQTTVTRGVARTGLVSRRTLSFVALAIVIAAVVMAPLVNGVVSLLRSGEYVSQQYFWRSAPRGVDVGTAVLGNPMHAISGGWTRRGYETLGIDVVEQTAWLGLAATVLLVTAVRRRRALPAPARPWFWIAGIFAIWSLGPLLTVAGSDTGILLPQALVRYIPFVSNARMPGRAIVVVQLAAAVLGAMIIAGWRKSSTRSAALIALIVFENFPAPYALYRLPVADSIDLQLKATARGAVVELPTGVRDGFGEWGRFDHRALMHQMTHQQPLVGGFAARVSPSVSRRYRENPSLAALFDLTSGFKGPESLPDNLGAALAAMAIGSVVVNTDSLTTPLRAALERRGLQFVMADRARELYSTDRLPRPPDAVRP